MLNQWQGHLYYFYTTTANAADAATLESQMIEAFRPPFNKRYEGVTSATMRALI
jgi:excinuclease UvrABC nuclease subunit